MDLNKMLTRLGETPGPVPREEKLGQTIAVCKNAYFLQERSRPMGYREFLWSQLCYTRKRWWGMQAALLLLACQVIPAAGDPDYRIRGIGMVGCLFVVLMIPELWRNRETASTQVEAACLYSLRQIYAARITLFGIVDVALLSVFSLGLGRMGFTVTEVMSQFLLPAAVTACICFSLLCGKAYCTQTVSLAGCLVWSGVWWLILRNERIYTMIVPAVWAALLGIALIFLGFAVHRTVYTANQSWEVAAA